MAKIVIILGRLVIGGSSLDTLQAVKYLQETNEIVIITGGKEENELEATFLTNQLTHAKHIRIEGFNSNFSLIKDFKTYLSVRKLLNTIKPAVVHTHSAKAGLIGRLAAKHVGVPYIIHTYHGLIFKGYYNSVLSKLTIYVERWLASKSTTIIALSENQKKEITEIYKICPPEKVQVLPLGIEMEKFISKQESLRASFQNKYFVADDEVCVGLIGRLVPIKNHDFFLSVIEKLNKPTAKTKFFIVGDGPLRVQLQQKASALNIQFVYFPESPLPARLTFTSWETNIEKVIAGLDIVVLTSHSEGTPVSLIEAQAASKPVVTVNTGGITDIVIHGKTGFVVEPGQIDSFSEYLSELVNNPELRQKMGAAGAKFVTSKLQKDKQVKALNKLYNSMGD